MSDEPASDAQLVRSYGRKARREGKTHLENPWDPEEHPKQHNWWLEGWTGRHE